MAHKITCSFFTGIIFTSLVLLTGCGPRETRYFPAHKHKHAIDITHKDLQVCLRLLDEQDCYDYFGYALTNLGYQALHLTVDNYGPDEYVFRPSYLDLPRESGEQIAKNMHYDTYTSVVLMTLPALIFLWEAIPLVVVPHGIYCKNYNAKTTQYIADKTLEHDETFSIAPYETVQKLIFVKSEALKLMFELKFFNKTSRKLLTYDINLVELKLGSKA
jgi:hypothetical protein